MYMGGKMMNAQNSEKEAKQEETEQEKTKQQDPFAEEQAEYWKSFVSDLFVGTSSA